MRPELGRSRWCLAERSQSTSPAASLEVELVLTVHIDVRPERRRDVRKVIIVDGNAVSPGVLERFGHVHRVPDDDRVGCEVQAEYLRRLVFELGATDLALISKEQEAPEIVKLLALVPLASDGSPIFRIVQATDDVDRLDQAPVLL